MRTFSCSLCLSNIGAHPRRRINDLTIASQLHVKRSRLPLRKNPDRFAGKQQIAHMYINATQPSQRQMVTASQFQDQDLTQFLVSACKHNFAIRRRNRFGVVRTPQTRARWALWRPASRPVRRDRPGIDFPGTGGCRTSAQQCGRHAVLPAPTVLILGWLAGIVEARRDAIRSMSDLRPPASRPISSATVCISSTAPRYQACLPGAPLLDQAVQIVTRLLAAPAARAVYRRFLSTASRCRFASCFKCLSDR